MAAREPRAIVVSVRPNPRLVLPVAGVGDKELTLRARARDGRSFAVALSMGGRPLGRLDLSPSPGTARLRVPASAQTVGESVLFFAAEDASTAFEVLELSLQPPGADSPPPQRHDAALRLPPSGVVLFPLARSEGRVVASARPTGDRPGRLRIAVETDAGTTPVDERELRRDASIDWPLPDAGGYAALRVENAGPGSIEVGRLGLVRAATPPAAHPATPSPAAAAPAPGRPSLVVYLTDTLRPDALGAYGQTAPVSPRFDAFAREAVVFETAWAQAPWTRSAVASLFTGVVESRHGVTGWKSDLDPALTTLAESLQSAGYRTAAFCANPLVQPDRGFGQGFDYWRPPARRMSEAPPAQTLVADALRWLDAAGDAPSLVYVHTLEPHTPYRAGTPEWRAVAGREPPPSRQLDAIPLAANPTPEQRALARAAYLAEARQNDQAFGTLLDGLSARGRLDASVVVFLADHGEELWEHGGHGHVRTLYEEMLRIPLAVRLPGGAGGGRRSPAPAAQVDVLPTLLSFAGVTPPPGLDGHDLGPALRGEAVPERTLRADTRVPPSSKRAVRIGPLKLVVNDDDERQWRGGARVELFDLAADPGETTNLAGRRRATARYLESLLRAADARAPSGATPERALSDSELEGLRALGYVQ